MFFRIYSFLSRLDWLLIGAVFVLMSLGLLSLYSTSFSEGLSFFKKQLLFVFLGIFVVIFVGSIDYRLFRNYSVVTVFLYFFCILLLLAVLLWGSTKKGMKGWLDLGYVNFEPVELAKLSIILVLAKYFSLRHVEMYRIRHIIVSGIYLAVPVGFVLLQPDLGSALVLGAIWLGIMVIAGIKWKHLLVLFLVCLIISAFAWTYLLKEYQKARILTFLDPNIDPLGQGYNRIQSIIAVGSGGWWGKGFGFGSQSQLNFLPAQRTDFIFASIAEEGGFLAVFIILFMFGMIFFRLFKIVLCASNNFSRLFVAGAAVMLLVQVMVNVGMNLGVLPITGISLPFVSYGGSNLLVNCIILGIVQSIYREHPPSHNLNKINLESETL